MPRRGTFKTIMANLKKTMSEIRSAFGRTAAKIAKEIMNDKINDLVPENARPAVRARPGDFWRAVVRHVYKAVSNVVKDKLARGELSIDNLGYFNVTKEDVLPIVRASGLDDDLRSVLRETYKVTV